METDNLTPTYNIRRLKPGDLVATFDCGDDDLNDFILNESPLYRKAPVWEKT